MGAVVAADAQNGPVWYKFCVVAGDGIDSGWQLSNTYTYPHTGGVVYQVITTDTDPTTGGANQNTTNWTAPSVHRATL